MPGFARCWSPPIISRDELPNWHIPLHSPTFSPYDRAHGCCLCRAHHQHPPPPPQVGHAPLSGRVTNLVCRLRMRTVSDVAGRHCANHPGDPTPLRPASPLWRTPERKGRSRSKYLCGRPAAIFILVLQAPPLKGKKHLSRKKELRGQRKLLRYPIIDVSAPGIFYSHSVMQTSYVLSSITFVRHLMVYGFPGLVG